MWKILRPPKHKPPVAAEKIDKEYKRLRLQVFIGIFIGYAGYYLVRKNFTLAMPHLVEMGFDKGDLGIALSANAIAYGLSKFLMGGVSDRSNARVFLPLGLVLAVYYARRRCPKCFEVFCAATCGPDLPAGGDIQFGDLQSDAGSGPEDDDSIRGDNR